MNNDIVGVLTEDFHEDPMPLPPSQKVLLGVDFPHGLVPVSRYLKNCVGSLTMKLNDRRLDPDDVWRPNQYQNMSK